MRVVGFPFEAGAVLPRKKIHEMFGGNEQRGISTPRSCPFVFLFTRDRGEEYGYQDYWEGGVFHYTGEGQRGDMRFTMGNKAMRDHVGNGERLFLFKERPDGNQEFIGEMAAKGWRYEPLKDVTGNVRQGIIFELVRV